MSKRSMGTFTVDAEFASLRSPRRFVPIGKMLVDSGSEYTWIPGEALRAAGVRQEKKDLGFVMADGRTITRSVGFVVLRAAGFLTVDEVVFGEPGDLSLLGSRTLEGFGARVDARLKRLVASGPHPAAICCAERVGTG